VALDYCRECGYMVSTMARRCPCCGVEDPILHPNLAGCLFDLFLTFIAFAFLGSVLSTFAYLLRHW
jgi:hypothetical protein